MVHQQIRTSGVLDNAILALIMDTPREVFVPAAYRSVAFSDTHVDLGHDQVMLTPYEEAALMQALQLSPRDRVLEIGTGSGYLTALMAKSAAHVESVDYFSDFTADAKRMLALLNIHNVTLTTQDATQGVGTSDTYQAVVITSSMLRVDAAWRARVVVGGRLCAIVGTAPQMQAVVMWRRDVDTWEQSTVFDTCVPALLHGDTHTHFEF